MIVLQKAEPEKTLQDSHLKPSKTNYLIQKKESITRLLQRGESAVALMFSRYAQIIKELCLFCNLHSQDTHRSYPSKIVFCYLRTNSHQS